MYQGKRLSTGGKRLATGGKAARRLHWPRLAASGVFCALALFTAADLTAAYLHDEARVRNTFVLGSVTPTVEESFSGRVKEHVTIQNGGNAPAYIRALAIISWKDAQGRTILSSTPEPGVDYAISGPDTGWESGRDGYYYYTQPVPPRGATTQLIQSLTDQNGAPDRQLHVDIIAQAVQTSPTQAVEDVFPGVSIGPDGTLTPPQP